MPLPDWIKNAKPGPNMKIPGEPGPIDEANYRRYVERLYEEFRGRALESATELRTRIPNFDTPKTIAEWKVAITSDALKGPLDGISPELLGIKPADKVTFQQLVDQMFKVSVGLPLNSDIETTDDNQKTALLLLVVLAVLLLILKRRK